MASLHCLTRISLDIGQVCRGHVQGIAKCIHSHKDELCVLFTPAFGTPAFGIAQPQGGGAFHTAAVTRVAAPTCIQMAAKQEHGGSDAGSVGGS